VKVLPSPDHVTELYLRGMNALEDHRGQGLVEYALIIGVVAVMLVGALISLRTGVITALGTAPPVLANNGGP